MSPETVKTVIVLGSGGHTSEMIKLLSGTDLTKFAPREYIVAHSDKMSIQKIKDFESSVSNNKTNKKQSNKFNINLLARSRSVGQSYITSILTTLIAILFAIPLMFKLKPSLLLVNGPGTCIPVCLILRLMYFSESLKLIPQCRIVFVESVCRVKNLSLSGKILYYLNITDAFFVQWEELKKRYPKAIHVGRLV